jgi:glycosyltransferase involved in cell wall biosynthesis
MDEEKIFTFICVKGWRGTEWDRGGVAILLRAFASEFSKDEKVQLVIKLNPAYINPDILNQSLTQLNLPENRAPIQIILDNTPFNKLVDLYNKADVYVCATRAEAFNLPGLEAMACGLPTIQTDFGGQTDYMTFENSLFVTYKLDEVKEDIMYEGCSWATPSIIDLRKQMRYAFEHPVKIKQMSSQALEDSKNWTWDKSAEKVIKCLEDTSKC